MGIGLLTYFAQREEPSLACLWLPPLLILPALLMLRRWPLASWAMAMAGMAALGFAVAAWQTSRLPPVLELPRKAVMAEGVVSAVDPLPEGVRVTLSSPRLSSDGEELSRTLRIRLRPKDPLVPVPGDRLRIRALVRPPAMPAYPGAWDFQRGAFFQGLGGSGFAIGAAERLGEPLPADPFAQWRGAINARITAHIAGGAGAVAAALLTGSQTAIPQPDMTAMRDSGLAHLLSVSGLHIAIVMGLGFGLVRFGIALVPWLALRCDSKAIAAPAGLVVGLGYVLLTGSQVPMLRSFAMAMLVTLGILLGRRALSLRALAIAATAVMLLQPDAVTGPSFQMSFAAVLVLIAGNEWMRPAFTRWRAGKEWWRKPVLMGVGLLLTSLLAGLATTPYGLHHFGRLQIYGVAANAIAIPLTSVLVMPAGMAALALMPFGLESWALAPMGWGVEATLLVARTIASWPGAALLAAPIPAWGLGVTSFGLLWLCIWQRRWRLLGIPMLTAGLSSTAWVTPPDILVAADARLIAFQTSQGVFLQRASGASSMVRDSWLRSWGEDDYQPVPQAGSAADGRLECTPTACRFQAQPEGPVAMLLRPERVKRGDTAPDIRAVAFCGQATLLLSAEPIRGRCRDTRAVDRFSVWRNGPHAIWMTTDGTKIVSDRDWRGQRPWVPPAPVPAWAREAAQ
jgi:competence protein ComEC